MYSIDSQVILAIYMRKSLYFYRTAHSALSARVFPPDHYYNCFRSRCNQNNNGNDEQIIRIMGEEVGLPPCLMARFILKSFINIYPLNDTEKEISVATMEDNDESIIDSEKQTSTAQFKSPSKIATARITSILRDPEQVRHLDPLLSINLHYCVQNDLLTSPLTDVYRRNIGLEKEEYMQRRLNEMNILFHSEADMRAAGYPKTPDALLAYPVEIDGHIVNWIESKALFSDGSTHQTYLKDQYWPYYNRFGPGLVIYWFGFLEEINDEREREKGIVVMDRFPDIINKIKY